MQNTRDEGGGWMAVLKKVKNKAFCDRLSTEKQRNHLIKKITDARRGTEIGVTN